MINGYCVQAKSEEWDVVVLAEKDRGHVSFKAVVDYCNKWEAFYLEKRKKIYLVVLESDPGVILELSYVGLREFVRNFNKPEIAFHSVALTG